MQKMHSVQIHGQVTIIGERSPILLVSKKELEKELPQLAVEILKKDIPISEKKFMESVAALGYQMMLQARAAGLTRP